MSLWTTHAKPQAHQELQEKLHHLSVTADQIREAQERARAKHPGFYARIDWPRVQGVAAMTSFEERPSSSPEAEAESAPSRQTEPEHRPDKPGDAGGHGPAGAPRATTTCEAFDALRPEATLFERRCRKPATDQTGWSPFLGRFAHLCDGHARSYRERGFVVTRPIRQEPVP